MPDSHSKLWLDRIQVMPIIHTNIKLSLPIFFWSNNFLTCDCTFQFSFLFRTLDHPSTPVVTQDSPSGDLYSILVPLCTATPSLWAQILALIFGCVPLLERAASDRRARGELRLLARPLSRAGGEEINNLYNLTIINCTQFKRPPRNQPTTQWQRVSKTVNFKQFFTKIS